MKRILSTLALSMLMAGGTLAEESKTYSVNQVTDASANTPSHMFRFEPDLLEVPLGATVKFDNFDGNHTVISIKKMTPEGGPKFKFSKMSPDRNVTFDTPGIYGVTCGIHGRFGMAMIIKVGEDNAEDLKSARTVVPGGRMGTKISQILDRLEDK
ncbi:plastocyanin/azurin family copper-binding protein [Pseudovibrio sp. JE062]|uniref:plastocyanin/azurin family copper-binding protein n=1 Tax=Pseudovibrio sp. JE062 TaxID=439495 RepID=UPI001AD8A039|nr:plastocyanin/azurin family copper-binding protein [Pseudovibrio sp. JE062]